MLNQVLLNGILLGFSCALFAAGFTLIHRTCRFLDFGFGAIAAVSSYLAFGAHSRVGIDLLPSCVIGASVATSLGTCIFLVVYRPLTGHDRTFLAPVLASLGVYIVLQNVLSLSFGDNIQTLHSWEVSEGYLMAGARITGLQILRAVATLVVLTALGTDLLTCLSE